MDNMLHLGETSLPVASYAETVSPRSGDEFRWSYAAMELALIPERTLLEAGALPFGELVRFATREGRPPRPIYQIHKWFARRLGCSFRALLVGAVELPTADLWKAYYETANLSGVTVLDPFVDGGTSVVEAARLGASAIGVDVDPIAYAVTNAELAASSCEDLLPTLRALQQSVGKTLAPFSHNVVSERRAFGGRSGAPRFPDASSALPACRRRRHCPEGVASRRGLHPSQRETVR